MNAEAAIHACHDAIAPDDFRIALDTLRDKFRMFDVIRLGLDDSRTKDLVIGDLHLFEETPLVGMTRIRGFEQDGARFRFPYEIDDVGHGHIVMMRARVVAPA